MDVWKLLSNIYKGGPTVVRTELDIYSEDANDKFAMHQLKEQLKKQEKRRNVPHRDNSLN